MRRTVLTALVGALCVIAIGATFSTATFNGRERSEIRAATDWWKRCVKADAVVCPPTTVPTAPTTTTQPAPVTTTTTKPPVTTTLPSGGMPTRANTGPSGINGTMTAAQFLASGSCDRKRISERIDGTGLMEGRTFTVENCALDGGIFYQSPSPNMPTVNVTDSSVNAWVLAGQMRANINRSFIQGAYWTGCPSCGAEDHQAGQTVRDMPITVRDSYFWVPAPDPAGFFHSEALHVVGGVRGLTFLNVRFTQEGPMNNNITGAIKFTGLDSLFDKVWFDFGGTAKASYFTVYFEGINITIKNCTVVRGVADYQYPDVWSQGNGYTIPALPCTLIP
jgi:hypothetical protein